MTIEQELIARLEESEARFRTMADCAPVLLWMADATSECVFFNATWLAFTGRTMEEEIGTGWAEGVHPEDFQHCMHVYTSAFVQRQPFRMEYRLRRADGVYRWVLDQGVPRFDTSSHFTGYIGSCVDITAFRDLQAELDDRVQQRTKQLATAIADLEAFSYSVSHDLRAPLRAIEGFSQALIEDHAAALAAEGKDYLQRVHTAAGRMSHLIDALLEMSRVGRVPLAHDNVDLSAIARAVIDDLAKLQPDREVAVSIAEGLVVLGDPRLLQIALQNLLDNAWKYTQRTERPRIELGTTERDRKRCFFVSDNGIGFEMAHSGQLFKAFHRLHKDAEFPGTGVGLATVSRVVTRHGGTIWADSKPGVGTTFYFTLPVVG